MKRREEKKVSEEKARERPSFEENIKYHDGQLKTESENHNPVWPAMTPGESEEEKTGGGSAAQRRRQLAAAYRNGYSSKTGESEESEAQPKQLEIISWRNGLWS